jgi:hypothetical protein
MNCIVELVDRYRKERERLAALAIGHDLATIVADYATADVRRALQVGCALSGRLYGYRATWEIRLEHLNRWTTIHIVYSNGFGSYHANYSRMMYPYIFLYLLEEYESDQDMQWLKSFAETIRDMPNVHDMIEGIEAQMAYARETVGQIISVLRTALATTMSNQN